MRPRNFLSPKYLFNIGDPASVTGAALLQERYAALQRQVPLLYLLICADFVGLSRAAESGPSINFVFGAALLAIVLVRLLHWLRNRNRLLSAEAVYAELRKTLMLAVFLSVSFAAWGIYLLENGTEAGRHMVVVFVSFTCIGCAYSLSSFPAAARMPLLLMAIPFAIRLIATREPGLTEAGISLAVATLLTLRMVEMHDASFSSLVVSRADHLLEREKAEAAQAQAIAQEKRALRIAATDDLTHLANRRAFMEAVGQFAAETCRNAQTLAILDLDGFKPINDIFGHSCGDNVLRQVAQRLKSAVPEGSLVARIGGDEFAVLAPSCSSEAEAVRLGERICAGLSEPFEVNGRELHVSASCGLTLLLPGELAATEALTRGDSALYAAKGQGRGRYAFFADDMGFAIVRRSQIEQALKEPEVHREMNLQYQPVFDLRTNRLRAFEALARWTDPRLPGLSPSEFIPIAEQIGAIEALTQELLKSAVREACDWPKHVRLSFNISAIPLCSVGYGARLVDLLRELRFDCGRLQLEVTETALLADLTVASENLRLLRGCGAKVVLDDFGAGFASLSYLREIEFDAIKLDGTLLNSSRPNSTALLKGVLKLCASLGVPCIAEHIETEEQYTLLLENGCRDGQGFLLSPPLTAVQARVLARLATSGKPGARDQAAA